MKPQTIGRVLGIGVRVAGRMAGQRLTGSGTPDAGNPGTGPATVQGVTSAPPTQSGGRSAGRATGSLARGVGGFLRPFRRIGNILFLEVVGVFFLLFVVVSGTWMWRNQDSAIHGAHHREFLAAAGMMVLFLYLSVSSFWRARRK